jgi:hypothetical protein
VSKKIPRHHAHPAGLVVQRHAGNVGIEQRLVGRRRVLVPGRQVDPELHHLELAASLGEGPGVELLVDDAGPSGHPLHVPLADPAAAAGEIAVL